MHGRGRAGREPAMVTDHVRGEAVRGAGGLRRVAAGKARGEVAGIEAVAGRGGVDRHHDFRHRHELFGAGRRRRARCWGRS